MKLSVILAALIATFTSTATFAECKTVMGGCVTEDAVNSAPHMHSDYTPAKTAAQKTQEKAEKSKQSVTAESKAKSDNKKL